MTWEGGCGGKKRMSQQIGKIWFIAPLIFDNKSGSDKKVFTCYIIFISAVCILWARQKVALASAGSSLLGNLFQWSGFFK